MQSAINNQEAIENTMYHRLVRLWLTAILLVLPFQLTVSSYIASWSSKLATIVNNLDELTIVIFLLMAIGELHKQREFLYKAFFFYSSR